MAQPLRVALGLSLDDEQLMRQVEAHARSLPGFKPRSEWRAEMASRMGMD